MTVERHACADGLTELCFKKHRAWAIRRFATKLTHAVLPAGITSRLPNIVQLLLGQIPPDWKPEMKLQDVISQQDIAQLPPVWTPEMTLEQAVEQIAIMQTPPEWPAGQELPVGITGTPTGVPQTPADGADAPLFLEIFTPGPILPRPKTETPAEAEPWFYDKFTTLDLTVWTENNYGTGTNTIDTGRLKQTAPVGSGAEIYTADDATIPATFEWTFDLTYAEDTGGKLATFILTAANVMRLTFRPPDVVEFDESLGTFPYLVTNFLGTTDAWKLTWNGTTCTLNQDGTEIFAGKTPMGNIGNAGRIYVTASGGAVIYLDELMVQEV